MDNAVLKILRDNLRELFIPLVLLFSLFLVQINGTAHAYSSNHLEQNNCTICKIISYPLNLTTTSIDIKFSFNLALIKLIQIKENYFYPESFILKSISPRAPPQY